MVEKWVCLEEVEEAVVAVAHSIKNGYYQQDLVISIKQQALLHEYQGMLDMEKTIISLIWLRLIERAYLTDKI